MLFVVVLVFLVVLVVPLVLVVRPCFSFFFVHDPSDLVAEQQEGNFGKLSFFKTRIQKPSRPQKGLN